MSASLNTSHVLIYLDKTVEFTRIPRGFKYISCSYLSRQSGTVGRRERSLNTSHVLIYLRKIGQKILEFLGLNTSHVLIYPLWAEIGLERWCSLNTSHVLIYPTFLSLSLIQYTPFLL